MPLRRYQCGECGESVEGMVSQVIYDHFEEKHPGKRVNFTSTEVFRTG